MDPRKGNILLTAIALLALVAAAVAGYLWWYKYSSEPTFDVPITWEQCLKTPGARVEQSYPPICVTKNGIKVAGPVSVGEKKKLQPPEETAKWEMYEYSLGYQFKYPQNWRVGDSELGSDQLPPIYYCRNADTNDCWNIFVGYISAYQQTLMGVSYCAFRQDQRCEKKTVGTTNISIDWAVETEPQTKAAAWISDPRGGIVTLELTPVNSETRPIFNQILSTFQFLDLRQSNSSIPVLMDTTNWKPSTNTGNNNIKFSFKYPPEWGNFDGDYCKTPPNPKLLELSANCIRLVTFTDSLPNENNFNMGHDVTTISQYQTNVSGYKAMRKVYALAESTLEGAKPIPNEPPSSYELWVYDQNNKPFFLWLFYIGGGTDYNTATNFVKTFDTMVSTLELHRP